MRLPTILLAAAGMLTVSVHAHDPDPLLSPFSAHAPVIDGNLSEWEDDDFIEVTPANGVFDHESGVTDDPDDFRFAFAVRNDATYLYVAVRIVDDVIVVDSNPDHEDLHARAWMDDAIEIFRHAKKYKTPIFSCSQHRFVPGFIGMRNHPQVGKVLGCSVYGGLTTEPHHGEFFWHGVHSAETLFTIMGTGCVSVTRTSTPDFELVVGVWRDGRIGTYRAMKKGAIKYSGIVFGDKGILRTGNYGYGVPMLWTPAKGEKSSAPKGEHWIAPKGEYMGYKGVAIEIAKFFRTGTPPVTAAETIEIFAFLEAAHESKRQGGTPVKLQAVIDRAAGKK